MPVDAQEVLPFGPDEEPVLDYRGRGTGRRIQRNLGHLGAGLELDHVQLAVAAGDEGPIVHHGGEAADLILALVLPYDTARIALQAVEVAVLGTDQDVIAVEVGAGIDLRFGVEVPLFLAGLGVEAVEAAVAVPGIDQAAADGGRGREAKLRPEFPDLPPGGEVDAVKLPVHAANVDFPLRDRRRRFEAAVFNRESPEESGFLGQCAQCHARGRRVTAEEWPTPFTAGGGCGWSWRVFPEVVRKEPDCGRAADRPAMKRMMAAAPVGSQDGTLWRRERIGA